MDPRLQAAAAHRHALAQVARLLRRVQAGLALSRTPFDEAECAVSAAVIYNHHLVPREARVWVGLDLVEGLEQPVRLAIAGDYYREKARTHQHRMRLRWAIIQVSRIASGRAPWSRVAMGPCPPSPR